MPRARVCPRRPRCEIEKVVLAASLGSFALALALSSGRPVLAVDLLHACVHALERVVSGTSTTSSPSRSSPLIDPPTTSG